MPYNFGQQTTQTPWQTGYNTGSGGTMNQWGDLMAQQQKGYMDSLQKYFSDKQNADQSAIGQYFDPALIAKYFNLAGGNLGAREGTDVSRASSGAAARAYSSGMLNPNGYISNAASRVQGAYAPQFAGLEMGRAGALQQNSNQMWQALMQLRNYQLQQKAQQDASSPNLFDYLGLATSIAGIPFTGGASLLGSLFGGGRATAGMIGGSGPASGLDPAYF